MLIDWWEAKSRKIVIGVPRLGGDGEEAAADTVDELVLVNALEGALLFLLVQAGASVGALAARLDGLRPGAAGLELRQGEVAMDCRVRWLEDAVREEQFDVKLPSENALFTTADESAGLLEEFLKCISGFHGGTTVLVAT